MMSLKELVHPGRIPNMKNIIRALLIQASDNAKNKALYLADNLGMQIGSVLEIQEGNISYGISQSI